MVGSFVKKFTSKPSGTGDVKDGQYLDGKFVETPGHLAGAILAWDAVFSGGLYTENSDGLRTQAEVYEKVEGMSDQTWRGKYLGSKEISESYTKKLSTVENSSSADWPEARTNVPNEESPVLDTRNISSFSGVLNTGDKEFLEGETVVTVGAVWSMEKTDEGHVLHTVSTTDTNKTIFQIRIENGDLVLGARAGADDIASNLTIPEYVTPHKTHAVLVEFRAVDGKIHIYDIDNIEAPKETLSNWSVSSAFDSVRISAGGRQFTNNWDPGYTYLSALSFWNRGLDNEERQSFFDSVESYHGINSTVWLNGWQKQYPNATVNVWGSHFNSSGEGWLCGDDQKIWYTNDGGASWSELSTGTTRIWDMTLVGNNGWAVMDNGSIYVTSDGFSSGQLISPTDANGNNFRGVFAVDSQIVYAVGFDGTVIKTSDAGSIWSDASPATNEHMRSVYFLDDNTGWVGDDNGGLHYTDDGGETWVDQWSDDTRGFRDILMHDVSSGVAATDVPGEIVKTSDGGSTWSVVDTGLTNGLRSLAFFDALNGYVFSNNEAAYTTDGGATWSVDTEFSTDLDIWNSSQAEGSIWTQGGSPHVDFSMDRSSVI